MLVAENPMAVNAAAGYMPIGTQCKVRVRKDRSGVNGFYIDAIGYSTLYVVYKVRDTGAARYYNHNSIAGMDNLADSMLSSTPVTVTGKYLKEIMDGVVVDGMSYAEVLQSWGPPVGYGQMINGGRRIPFRKGKGEQMTLVFDDRGILRGALEGRGKESRYRGNSSIGE